MITELSHPLAVVPIFVNAGAALVPTLVAAFTSFIAVLLKPKELLTLFRRKPWLPVSIIAALVAVGLGISHLLAAPATARASGSPTTVGNASAFTTPDWTKLALKLLEDERNANKTTGVKPLWDYAPDPTAMTLSSAAYADKTNRVFATASVQDVASFFGVLYGLDADTGREIWKTDKAGDADLKAFFSSPALTADQKYLIVGQGLHEDRDCALLCFDTDTGALKWSVKTPLHIESSPAVHGDLAVVGAGAIEGPDHKPTSHPGYVFAVQISTGKELWRHDVPDPESSPAIADDGTVYIGAGFNGNAVVALRSEPDEALKSKQLKRELWRTKAPYPITAPVTLAGDLLLVGGGNSDFVNADPNPAGIVLALDRKTGSIKWQTPTDDAVLSKIVVADNKVFCPVRNGQVLALDLATGQPLWKRFAHNKSPLKAGLALSPDHSTIYAPTADGHLTLLSTTDGHAIESHPLNNPAKPGDKSLTLSTPTLAHDKLFVGSETGGLRTFQLLSPKPN